MIKKIFVIILVAFFITSCGKKGDPIYNEDKQNTEISSTQQSALT
jgi:predicted small lipoprotein YifL